MHLCALRREQVRDGVAHRDPSPAARVERPGGVGGDELEVDALPGERVGGAVRIAGRRRPSAARREARSARGRGSRSRAWPPRPGRGAARRPPRARRRSAAAMSIGLPPTAFWSASATGVAQSPRSRCLGGSSTMPLGGSGRVASASARRTAWARSSRIMWSRQSYLHSENGHTPSLIAHSYSLMARRPLFFASG